MPDHDVSWPKHKPNERQATPRGRLAPFYDRLGEGAPAPREPGNVLKHCRSVRGHSQVHTRVCVCVCLLSPMVGKISTLILALNVNDTSVRQLIRVVAPVHPVRLGDGIFNRSCALLRTTAERGKKWTEIHQHASSYALSQVHPMQCVEI